VQLSPQRPVHETVVSSQSIDAPLPAVTEHDAPLWHENAQASPHWPVHETVVSSQSTWHEAPQLNVADPASDRLREHWSPQVLSQLTESEQFVTHWSPQVLWHDWVTSLQSM
jgi:hypothetical protein